MYQGKDHLVLNKLDYWIEYGTEKKYNNTGDNMKLNRIQKLLLGMIAFSLSFSLLLNVVGAMGPLSMINREGYGFFSMLQYTMIDYPVHSIKESLSIFTRMWQLEKENEILRAQIEGLAASQALMDEQQRQISELKQLIGLKSVISDYDVIPATILSRSAETWNNVIVIDVGSSDGVEENYAIISVKGLIGRVQSVSEHTSIVKLITVGDGSNKVSVKIEIGNGIMADAILERYDYNEQAFVVKLLDSNNTVTENMQVVTSGMGGVFPSGLLVGRICRVEELSNAIGVNVYVTPAADFQELKYIYVVKRLGLENE